MDYILKRIEELMDAKPNTKEFYELDALADLVITHELSINNKK